MDNPWNLDTITDPASTKQPTNTTQLASPGRGQTAFEFCGARRRSPSHGSARHLDAIQL